MSTICTCANAQQRNNLICNYAEGCPYVTTRIDPVNNIGKTAMKIAEEMKAGITSDNRGLLKLFINNSDKDSIEIERGVKIEIPDGTQFRIRYDKNKKALDVIKINDYGASEEITVNPSSCNQVFIK